MFGSLAIDRNRLVHALLELAPRRDRLAVVARGLLEAAFAAAADAAEFPAAHYTADLYADALYGCP